MLNLSTDVTFKVVDGKTTLLSAKLKIKNLTKKEQKEMRESIGELRAKYDDNDLGIVDDLELTAQRRFDLTVSGSDEDVEKVREIAEEYGYLTVFEEIDKQVAEAKGKR